MSIFPSIKWILFDGLFSGQSGHSSKELLCLKNLVLAHSIFDDTSNEKRPKMKNRPQIQTSIWIRMFQNIALALGGSITFRERALPSLGFWRLLSSPQKPKLSASNPRNRDSGFSPNPYYLCIWSPMNRDSWLSLFWLHAGPIHATVKIISTFELKILTVASRLMLSRLRPRYAKVFKFHWL